MTLQPGKVNSIKGVEIELQNLITTSTEEKILDESIYELYSSYPLTYDLNDDNANKISPSEVIGFAPIDQVTNFQILGVGFDADYNRTVFNSLFFIGTYNKP